MSLVSEVADARVMAYGGIERIEPVANRPVIIGLGNVLLGDDGAGVQVIERLGHDPSLAAGADLLDGGTLNFTLLEYVESAPVLIFVDATNLGLAPGSVRVFADAEMDAFLAAADQRSVHDLNLGDLLRMCALRDCLPERRFLVAIQPESIDWNGSPTPAVEAGVQKACERIRRLLEEVQA